MRVYRLKQETCHKVSTHDISDTEICTYVHTHLIILRPVWWVLVHFWVVVLVVHIVANPDKLLASVRTC